MASDTLHPALLNALKNIDERGILDAGVKENLILTLMRAGLIEVGDAGHGMQGFVPSAQGMKVLEELGPRSYHRACTTLPECRKCRQAWIDAVNKWGNMD